MPCAESVTRKQFETAVEAGIEAAVRASSDWFPTGWADKLRTVARTTDASSVGWFDSCPIQQAGFMGFPLTDERAWAFIDAYDANLSNVSGGMGEFKVIG